MSHQPNRRTILQAALAAVASFFLPRVLTARSNPRSFWFLHTPTRESWLVDDPVAWSANAALVSVCAPGVDSFPPCARSRHPHR
jgi:hypothetical protein